MAFDLNAFNQEFGHTSTGAGYNPGLAGGGVTTPKSPGFFSQVGHSIATAVPTVATAIGHQIVDPFSRLISNNVNAANQGANANSINAKRAALDAASHSTLKAYTDGHITKDQYNQQSRAQMKAYQDLQSESQGNIDSVKSTAQMLPDAVSAATTAATLGAGGIELGAAKAGAEALGARVAGNIGAKVAGKVVQGAGDIVGAKATAPGLIKQIPGAIIHNAVVAQPTVQFASQAANDVKSGNVKAALGDAALAAAPAGLGLVVKGARAVLPGIKDALHGTPQILTDAFGVNRVKDFVAKNANNPEAITRLKQMEMFTANQKNQAGLADHLLSKGIDPKTAPMEQIVKEFSQYEKNVQKLEGAKGGGADSMGRFATPGTNPDIHPNAVVSADFRSAIPKVAQELAKLGDNPSGAERVAAANKALDDLGIKNPTVRNQIGAAITEVGTGSQMAKNLKPIVQKFILKTPKGLLDKGYIATEGPKERAYLPTFAEAKDAGMPKIGTNPHGLLGQVGTALDKAGLGLKTTPSSTTQGMITENLNKRLEGTTFAGRGKEIMGQLHDATSKTRGVFDPRLLRATTAGLVPGAVNIEHEFGVAPQEAKTILKALKGAYGDLPLGVRSLGEKLTDKTIQHLPPMASFLKAQGYGKYTANPFFWAKQGTKGEFIAHAETGGKALNVGRTLNTMLGTAPKQSTMDALRGTGVFTKAQSAGGEADFFGNLAPELGAKVTGPEVSGYIQQSMGQAAEQFAKNNGTTVQDILKGSDGQEHPHKKDFDNLMQMVVGYPKGDNALNSNLAKSLNVLVFPSRFELKVAGATAHYFLHQPKVVQLAMINSVLKANAWAGSPEGKQWQKDNADLLGVINYFSPTHSIQAVAGFAKSGNLADLGQVGGMPFGVITTILKNQGVALPNQLTGTDVNPATGENYVQKLPATDKARIQQGITDLIGQMFSFPGATVGLPSKTSVIQSVPGLKPGAGQQTIVKPTGGSSPVKTTPMPAVASRQFTPFSGEAKVAPVYKKGTVRTKKAKTLAKLPGTF